MLEVTRPLMRKREERGVEKLHRNSSFKLRPWDTGILPLHLCGVDFTILEVYQKAWRSVCWGPNHRFVTICL